MAEPKEKESFEELLFKYIYNSMYDRGAYDENDPIYAPSEELEQVIKGSRSYDEARNRIISRLKNDEKEGKGKSLISNSIKEYNDIFGNPAEGIVYDENSFPNASELNYKDIVSGKYGASGFDAKDIVEKAKQIRETLGVDPSVLYNTIFPESYGDEPDVVRNVFGSVEMRPTTRNMVKKFLENKDLSASQKKKIYRELGIVPGQDEYLYDYISDILLRNKRIGNEETFEEKYPVADWVEGFSFPHGKNKVKLGNEPNVADNVADLAPWALAGVAAKASALKRAGTQTLKNALATSDGTAAREIKKALSSASNKFPLLMPAAGVVAADQLLELGHDVADSLLTKHTYSEAPGDTIVKSGDAMAVLKNTPEYVKNLKYSLPLVLLGVGAQKANGIINASREALGKVVDKVTGVTKKRNALEALTESGTVSAENIVKKYDDALSALQTKEAQVSDNITKSRKALEDTYDEIEKAKNAKDKKRVGVAKKAERNIRDNISRLENQSGIYAGEKAALEVQKKAALEELMARNEAIKIPLEKSLSKSDATRNFLYDALVTKNATTPEDYAIAGRPIRMLMP